MKVVLLSDVKGTGRRGELHDVADGYYRNFLIPKGLAAEPNDPRAKKILAELSAKSAAAVSEIESIRKTAAALDGRRVEISAKSQNGGRLFGAIHETEVASALGIDKKLIKMEPIKALGEHQVKLQFSHGIEATIMVSVVAS
jgi:large subunit ribosomal protein L9